MGRGGGSSKAKGGGGGATATATPRGAASGSGGLASRLTFVPPPDSPGRVTVMIDVAKLEASLAADAGFHVGRGGTGPSAIGGRYAGARAFLEKAAETGQGVHMAKVFVDKDGNASISDGRHRFAALRDSGATALPVSVPKGSAARVRRLFGA